MLTVCANRKAYSLWIDVDIANTDGYDLIGYPIDSICVSRKVFGALVEGLKIKGFKNVKEVDNMY